MDLSWIATLPWFVQVLLVIFVGLGAIGAGALGYLKIGPRQLEQAQSAQAQVIGGALADSASVAMLTEAITDMVSELRKMNDLTKRRLDDLEFERRWKWAGQRPPPSEDRG